MRDLDYCNLKLGPLYFEELCEAWMGLTPQERQEIVLKARLPIRTSALTLPEVIRAARKKAPYHYEAPEQAAVVAPILRAIEELDYEHRRERLTLEYEQRKDSGELDRWERDLKARLWSEEDKREFLDRFNLKEEEVEFLDHEGGLIKEVRINHHIPLDPEVEEQMAKWREEREDDSLEAKYRRAKAMLDDQLKER